jgi:hypothetical protein
MHETFATLTPVLAFFASIGGAGLVGSRLFDVARELIRKPIASEYHNGSAVDRLVWSALYAPRYARWTAFTFTALTSVVFSVLAALATGEQPQVAIDAALAVIVSQLIHGAGLSGRV